jgi:dihydrofolate reductase
MARLIEYTLVSVDGVVENPAGLGFMAFRDDAYLRDGLGVLSACGAMLMGRRSYETNKQIWPSRTDPWAKRLNSMKKFVFSSTLEDVDWENTTLVRGDAASEVAKLKRQEDRDLLIWGHTQLAETLLREGVTDVIDLSVHPVIVGAGKQFFREGQSCNLQLVATKTFGKIVKLTYEPQH